MKKYISKGDWFDKGTTAELMIDFSDTKSNFSWGLFLGIKDGKPDEETCNFDEFEIIEWDDFDPNHNYNEDLDD